MRIKTLLCVAALTAGITSSMAQVYSLNVVGYVKKSYPKGYSMIANPLKTTNDTVAGIFGGVGGALPEGAQLYLWDSATAKYVTGTRDDLEAKGWGPAGFENQAFAPGRGAFLSHVQTAPVEVVYVGEVLQNADSNMPVGKGYQLLGSKVPQAGRLDTAAGLNFPVVEGDQVYLWDAAGQKYATYTADSLNDPPPWGATSPNLGVAEGFFSSKLADANWVRDFKVPQ